MDAGSDIPTLIYYLPAARHAEGEGWHAAASMPLQSARAGCWSALSPRCSGKVQVTYA